MAAYQRRGLVLLLLLGLAPLSAAELRILTENYPPFNYEDPATPGKPIGLCVAIVEELRRRTGTAAAIEIWPWEEAFALAKERPDTALFSTTRTPAREDHFVWIGPLAHNDWALFARRGAGIALDQLADAAPLRIGTYRDDAVDTWLREQGLAASLHTTIDDRLNARKLREGRIDLWAGGVLQLPFKYQQAGYNPAELEAVLELQRTEIHLAFHPDTADTTLTAWREAFAGMQSDGSLAGLQAEYGLATDDDAP